MAYARSISLMASSITLLLASFGTLSLVSSAAAEEVKGASATAAETLVGTAVCIETVSSSPYVTGDATRNCAGNEGIESPAPPPVDQTLDPTLAAVWGAPAWRDEFSGSHVSPSNWNVRTRANFGLGIDAGIPDEKQVSVSGGLLHIRGDWLTTPQTRTPSATGVKILTHKTGYLDHRKLHTGDATPYAQQYGRWEMRAKVPTGPRTTGALAAFWLRNSQSGEIDIMESWGYGDVPRNQRPGTSTTTVHTKTDGSGVKKFWPLEEVLARKTGSAKLPAVHLDYHVWALEFTPSRFTMFYDGTEVFTTTPTESPDFWNPAYFGSPLHVRLNLHVGPSESYWGLPDPARRELTQPLDFQVDYIRIWAMPK